MTLAEQSQIPSQIVRLCMQTVIFEIVRVSCAGVCQISHVPTLMPFWSVCLQVVALLQFKVKNGSTLLSTLLLRAIARGDVGLFKAAVECSVDPSNTYEDSRDFLKVGRQGGDSFTQLKTTRTPGAQVR